MTRPSVDVVVPTRGRPAWCEEAVRSALSQEGVDVRVLVALDGAQPDTRARIEALSDPRATVLEHAPAGHAAARNLGLSAATAPLVAFLDDDDVLLPGALLARALALDRHPEAVLVHGRPVAMEADGTEVPGSRAKAAVGVERCGPWLREIVRGRSVFPSAAMARRDAVERVGRFDATLSTGEDWAFFLRLSALGPFVFLPVPTVLYRRHPGQIRARPAEQEAGLARFAQRALDAPDVAPEVARRRDALLGLHYAWIARNYRRVGDARGWRRCWRAAVRLRPSLCLHPRRFWHTVVAWCGLPAPGRRSPASRGGPAT